MTALAETINGYSREALLKLLKAVFAPPKRKVLGLCARCGVRRRTAGCYCDECRRAIGREEYQKKRARLIAQGKEILQYSKIEPTEKTNNTFFSEAYELIFEEAHNWALNVAKHTKNFDAVPDYRQEILLFLWKETLFYDPTRWVSPKTFVLFKAKIAVAALYKKLNAKKRIFWDSVLHLEDFVKPNNKHNTWEDFIQGKEQEQ